VSVFRLWLAPFNPSIARMEFRIFYNIFCETYKIQKTAFAFNEYVEKVFEKYILSLIEIRPVDWLALVGFVLLNWARNALHLDYKGCEHLKSGSHGTDDHSAGASHGPDPMYIKCLDENSRVMFTVAGIV
jgi:hypothetical protein